MSVKYGHHEGVDNRIWPASLSISSTRGSATMSNRLVHGYAWVTHPDVFGLDVTEVTNPGHPFSFRPGEVTMPAEVVYFRPASPGDAGVGNELLPHSYLVFTKTQLHPRVSNGWDSDPAILTEKF